MEYQKGYRRAQRDHASGMSLTAMWAKCEGLYTPYWEGYRAYFTALAEA